MRGTGSTALGRRGRRLSSGKLGPHRPTLIGWVHATPDMIMPALAAQLRREHGVAASPATLSRLLYRAGLT